MIVCVTAIINNLQDTLSMIEKDMVQFIKLIPFSISIQTAVDNCKIIIAHNTGNSNDL